MAIFYYKQDITTIKADYICHQVNCFGKMGTGVAKAIREKWPKVYEEYRNIISATLSMPLLATPLLGSIQEVEVENGQKIINMFAQSGYGYDGERYTSYDAFWTCLEKIKKLAAPCSTIAFPYKIGCGLGGANWQVIFQMIVQVLGENYDVIFCYLE